MESEMIINLGPVDRVPLGQAFCFIIQNTEIAVIRPRTGGIFAIENRCPHRGGPLSEGIVGDGKVVCPLHGHKFDLTTGQGSESPECIKTFKAWEEKKDILIEYPLSIQKRQASASAE